MPTVAFYTLGCKVNAYETEAIWHMFEKAGYERVDFEREADVYVINTCTVTHTGDKKSRQIIRRAIRNNPEAIVAVTGCYAQTSPADILNIPGVDIVVGTQGRDRLLDYVETVQRTRQPINAVTNIMKTRTYEPLEIAKYTERTRAFLKIQEGCNNFCTFCIIPWAKGLSRSRRPEDVLKEAQRLAENGYKEIVLTGIHTGGYGEDLEDYSLAHLLRDLSRVEGLERIRISSIEASQITEDVLEAFASTDKLCRHFHVPLQAGSDPVLKRMRRKYTTAEFARNIERVRHIFPDAAITTDLIVGFPGETEEMFLEGYRFVEALGFSELHVFPYSKRTGTPAARYTDQVDEGVKRGRVLQMLGLNEQLKRRYRERFLNAVLTVIPEGGHDGQDEAIGVDLMPDHVLLTGLTDNYLRVQFPGKLAWVGQLLPVRLETLTHDGFLGTPVGAPVETVRIGVVPKDAKEVVL
ncbi:MAG: tRNA (N(6)-L-threonylcarbamoyladenosine(37)-C(2))-methylthiotransferase MtaB [Candidatus Carbobacillus sp.]|nr:tRNA (N(6)-L-threonylcarbamoyladenosine(37)-C(2))-methylthiotransferase MtaB [Candidatus Carbobacillus sp.]